MRLSPDEISHRLGEAWLRETFRRLSTPQMRDLLMRAKLPAQRLLSQVSTRARNEAWAANLWRALATARGEATAPLLYQWLSQHHQEMLGAFLDLLKVSHKQGVTTEKFWSERTDEEVLAAATELTACGRFDRRTVAAYLLFLEATYKTERLAPLDLAKQLAQTASAIEPAAAPA